MKRSLLVGPHTGVFDSHLCGVHIEGIELESTYLWGLFRSRDTEPDIFTALRRLSPAVSWPARLLTQTNRGLEGVKQFDPVWRAARSSDVVSGTVGGAGTDLVAAAAAADRHYIAAGSDVNEPFRFAVTDGEAKWSEGVILHLEGAEVGPGLQWCLPPTSDSTGMRYASRIFRVEGHVDGVEVEGFVGCDDVRLAPGVQSYVNDPLTATHMSEAWCTWATAYDDGSIEAGHVAFGPDGFGFGLRSTNGAASVTTDVTGRVTRDARGCPTHVGFRIDGEDWEFVADERGAPIEPLPGPVRQSEGWFRRVGESRRPITWCATPEVPAP